MTKKFCDLCGKEITGSNAPFGGSNGRLGAILVHGGCELSVEVITGTRSTWNEGDFCKYCILDALYKADDRPSVSGSGRRCALGEEER